MSLPESLGWDKGNNVVSIPTVSVAPVRVRCCMQHAPKFYMACRETTMFPLLAYRSTQFHFIPYR